MKRNPLDIVYGSIPARFESIFALTESVRRLRDATVHLSFSGHTDGKAVGKVSERRVVLQRPIPYVQNAFKPFFIGQFKRTTRGIVLEGRFTMHWTVKLFMTLWLGMSLIYPVLSVVEILAGKSTDPWWQPLAGSYLFLGGMAFVQLGRYFARKDPAWLSSLIEQALAGSTQSRGPIRTT